MSYTAEISRANPACILFLLDQSGSMNEHFALPGEPPIAKAKGVADAINRLIGELIVTCTEEDTVLDRFHLGVITYGSGQASLAPAFPMLRALSEVAANPLRVETRTMDAYDGAGGVIRKEARMPIWFEPLGDGNTPMCSALDLAKGLIGPWSASHPQSFPPIIFNITDGVSTDGDPLSGLRGVQNCGTQDGQALTINMLLADGRGGAVVFPSSPEKVPDGPLRSLVEGSSVLPDAMRRRAAQQHEMTLPEGARGVVLNAHLVDVIRLLDIGTRPVNA